MNRKQMIRPAAKFFLSLGLVIFLFSTNVEAQHQITISVDIPMSFGTVTLLSFGVTNIVLSPNGTISGTNIVATGQTAAFVQVYGQSFQSVNVTITSSGFFRNATGDVFAFGSFTHDLGPSPTFNKRGKLKFNIGATLTTSAYPTGGDYFGFYTITVDYN